MISVTLICLSVPITPVGCAMYAPSDASLASNGDIPGDIPDDIPDDIPGGSDCPGAGVPCGCVSGLARELGGGGSVPSELLLLDDAVGHCGSLGDGPLPTPGIDPDDVRRLVPIASSRRPTTSAALCGRRAGSFCRSR